MQAVVWAVDSGDRAEEQGRRRGVLRGLVASSVTAYRESPATAVAPAGGI